MSSLVSICLAFNLSGKENPPFLEAFLPCRITQLSNTSYFLLISPIKPQIKHIFSIDFFVSLNAQKIKHYKCIIAVLSRVIRKGFSVAKD